MGRNNGRGEIDGIALMGVDREMKRLAVENRMLRGELAKQGFAQNELMKNLLALVMQTCVPVELTGDPVFNTEYVVSFDEPDVSKKWGVQQTVKDGKRTLTIRVHHEKKILVTTVS